MIRINGLYKSYEGNDLYQNFSIDFEKRKVTTLLGPSGCGKTTLLRILAGLEPYDKGEIIGINREKVSMVFQEDRCLPWLNVYDNIYFVLEREKLTKEQADSRISEQLKILKLEGYEHAKLASLSGGMQRRVSLARALSYKYDCLLMDEPFKGMDRHLKLEIMKELKKEWKLEGKTVILITHDAEVAITLSDTIYELYSKPVKWKKYVDNMGENGIME